MGRVVGGRGQGHEIEIRGVVRKEAERMLTKAPMKQAGHKTTWQANHPALEEAVGRAAFSEGEETGFLLKREGEGTARRTVRIQGILLMKSLWVPEGRLPEFLELREGG